MTRIEVGNHVIWTRPVTGAVCVYTRDEGLQQCFRLMEIDHPESVSILVDDGEDMMLLLKGDKYYFANIPGHDSIEILEKMKDRKAFRFRR